MHTCKIKEKHNYFPTKSTIIGIQTEYLVLYIVHISYAKGYKLFTSYYVIYCTVLWYLLTANVVYINFSIP